MFWRGIGQFPTISTKVGLLTMAFGAFLFCTRQIRCFVPAVPDRAHRSHRRDSRSLGLANPYVVVRQI
jgi:hypothetical protein